MNTQQEQLLLAKNAELEKELALKNRELQIEAALEQVRTQTMAMYESKELSDTATVLFRQLRELGGNLWSAGFVLLDAKSEVGEFRMSNPDGEIQPPIFIPNTKDPATKNMHKYWENGADYYFEEAGGKELKKHYEYLLSLPEARPAFQALLDAGIALPTWQQWHAAYFSAGYLLIIAMEPFKEIDLLKRFAKSFQQTYIRFLDLQKAETQAREAQIEVALERVRGRTMAMQHSDELPEVALVIWEQLDELKLEGLPGCAIHVNDDDQGTFEVWAAFPDLVDGEVKMKLHTHPHSHNQHCIWVFREWDRLYRAGEIGFAVECNIEQLNEFIDWFAPYIPMIAEEMRSLKLDKMYVNGAAFSNGIMGAPSLEPLSEDTWSVFKRLAGVFDLAYRRFEDLKKAEKQAREAQIEAALERIRSRSMAMQSSDELMEVVKVMYDQVEKLGIAKWGCMLLIFDKEKQNVQGWFSEIVKAEYTKPFDFDNKDHEVIRRWWDFWESEEKIMSIHLKHEEKHDFTRYLFAKTGMKIIPEEVKKVIMNEPEVYFKFVNMGCGIVEYVDIEPFPQESIAVLKRITSAFEQAYIRFLDIEKAEAQVREAQIEAALERVRSTTMAMHNSNELSKVVGTVFKELQLSIDSQICILLIFNWEKDEIVWWSTGMSVDVLPEGYRIPLSQEIKKNDLIKRYLKEHKQSKPYSVFKLSGKTKSLWDNYIFEHSELKKIPQETKEAMMSFESVFLSDAFSRFGTLEIAGPEPLSEEQAAILQRFSKVVEQTYTRFNDLKIAEALRLKAEEDLISLRIEKKRAEEALSELKSTQAQLIQSEKMASLGELTAGIAHEIQNPLNFVNNFSEVSKELVGEMREELDQGDIDEAKEIAGDLDSNLDKINHHGQRASAIVKGMLEHSRAGDGKKEPTDLNALADEYLRLAYHGLRAKDKSFQPDFKTKFAENLPKIDVVPQDIGRVLLNLINNAFYAVDRRSKEGIDGYRPVVIVGSKVVDGSIEISVKDNGAGIPGEIKDKIFQPFFTTKPTGEGTGLGLSLSYDIVTKGHGGELHVETLEGEGTTFTIKLS